VKQRRYLLKMFEIIKSHQKPIFTGLFSAVALAAVVSSHGDSDSRIIFRSEGPVDFKNSNILGNPTQTILKGEQTLFSKQQKNLLESQGELKSEIEKLREEVKQLNSAKLPTPTTTLEDASPPLPKPGSPPDSTSRVTSQINPPLAPPSENFQGKYIDQTQETKASPARSSLGLTNDYNSFLKARGNGRPGASMISFPVKTTGSVAFKAPEITLPSGSYVKAKLLTGVEAPEGRTYPALLQLDFAYIIPNHKRLDLAGCFIIAKAQGDLSTERVQMQATKLSCVSKRGGMFEREVNGFIADDKDNSFSVMGTVNTKQDRVAAMAFLAGVVSGVGKAIQQAQTTQQTTPLGGSQSVITGDQAKYIAAGGASEAATLVSQWYLKQAQNLLPTINIGSGQDVWIIMQDKVELPKAYFTQNSDQNFKGGFLNASIYTHFTRLVD